MPYLKALANFRDSIRTIAKNDKLVSILDVRLIEFI